MDGITALREGKILFASGQPGKSIPCFTAALEQGMDPVIIGLNRGTANLALGRYLEAREDFSLVLANDRENERGYFYRGIAGFALGEYETAIEDLTRSLTKNHSRGVAYLVRGLAYAELGEERDASLDFNSAGAFFSSEVESFMKLFKSHSRQLNRTMAMLKKQSAPWKALLTREEADRIRSWIEREGQAVPGAQSIMS
jgi:tetratricopeptide (TPR) repeat protein